jgi:hypothetical protein
MPKAKASIAAVTQPEFTTNEVAVKGKKVVIEGELAAELQNWLQYKNRLAEPVLGSVTLASVLRGISGAALGKQVEATIALPADLLAWASDEAYNLNGELSDIVRELLEYERYRCERLCTYVSFEREKKKGRKTKGKAGAR